MRTARFSNYISGEPVKDTPKEQVRQRIARALFHEYGISVEDMVRDFKMNVDGRRKSVDMAIFEPRAEKTRGESPPDRSLRKGAEDRVGRS